MQLLWNDIVVPEPAASAIVQAWQEAGEVIPLGFLIALAHEENGAFDCMLQSRVMRPVDKYSDITGRENSWGIFQLNINGVGSGHTVQELQNCLINARVAIDVLSKRYAKSGNLVYAAEAWSTKVIAAAQYNASPQVWLDGALDSSTIPPPAALGDTAPSSTPSLPRSSAPSGLPGGPMAIAGLTLVVVTALWLLSSDQGTQNRRVIYV